MSDYSAVAVSPSASPTLAPPRVNAVEYVHVSKVFGSTRAVDDVTFGLETGTVTALVGENGAGKSTLTKLLAGVYQPDGGHLRVAGDEVAITDPLKSQEFGIAVVHQHPSLFLDLSIAENVFAGRPLRTPAKTIDHAAMRRQASELLERLGLDVSVEIAAAGLRTSEQQLVEIARALASDAKVLILDEPTASLTTREVERLFGVIRQLRESGVALMFIGHRLDEIFAISDRLVVLRDGHLVKTLTTADTTQSEVVGLMVGREISLIFPDRVPHPGGVSIELQGLGDRFNFEDVSFTAREGQIVGLAGLVGSGRSEVARAVFGLAPIREGRVLLAGQPVRVRGADGALAHGIAYVSEDRRGESIVETFSILDNATLPVVGRTSRLGFVRRRLELAVVAGPLQRMRLKFADFNQPIGALSGGNQQKVVLAKWLATNPRVLILDEPTQGIDVQAKAEVHRIIAELAAQGLAIILISSDMPELLGMCDVVHVMRQGHLVSSFAGEEITELAVAGAATGLSASSNDTPARPNANTAAPIEAAADDGNDRKPKAVVQAEAARSSAGRRALAVLRQREVGLLVALLVIAVPLGAVNPRIFSSGNLDDLVTSSAMLSLVVLGEMLVMLTRNIDLSVGSTAGLAAFLSTGFMKYNPSASILIGILVAVAIGAAAGAVNGLVVAYGRVPSIVVTLGTLAIIRGIDAIVASGVQFSASDVPPAWTQWAIQRSLGLPTIDWIALVILVGAFLVLRYTPPGREIFAVGSNPEGADLIGIRVARRTFLAFVLSGSFAGLYGALTASRLGQVDISIGTGLELTVVASAVVGGVALRGGRGTVIGIAIGTFALYLIQNVLALVRVPAYDLQAVYGAALLATVAIDVVIASRAASRRGILA